MREGEEWLRYLRRKFPDALPAEMTLAEFAISRATENAEGQSQIRVNGLIQGFIAMGYSAFIEDNADEFQAYMQRAEELWNAYLKRSGGGQRTELIPLPELKRIVLEDMLNPKSGLSPERRARLRQLPLETFAPAPAPAK